MKPDRRVLILATGDATRAVVDWVQVALGARGLRVQVVDLAAKPLVVCHEPREPFEATVHDLYRQVMAAQGIFLVTTEVAKAPSVLVGNTLAWMVAAHKGAAGRVLDDKVLGVIGIATDGAEIPVRIFSGLQWQWGSLGAVVVPNPVALDSVQAQSPAQIDAALRGKIDALLSTFVDLTDRFALQHFAEKAAIEQ